MDNEEQTAQEAPTEAPEDNLSKGNEPQADNIIDRADAIRKGLEEAIKKNEEILRRQEAVAARMMLAGKADAGSVNKPKEEEEKEEAEKQAKEIISRFRR